MLNKFQHLQETDNNSMEQIDFEKFFYNLSLGWFYTEPVLFQVYMTHRLEKYTEMNCGIRSGQGKIQYNPEFLMNYSQKQVKDELRYELYRIMLRHPYRKKPYKADEEMWFKASEITIKQIFLNTYGLEKNQSIEYYYEKLSGMEKGDEEEDAETCDAAGGEGSGGEKGEAEEKQSEAEEKKDDTAASDSENEGKNSEGAKQKKSRSSDEGESEKEKSGDDEKSSQVENSSESEESEAEKSGSCSENCETEKSNSENRENKNHKRNRDSENQSSQSENQKTFSQTELWGEDDLQSEAKVEAVLINAGGSWGTVPESIRREVEKLQIKPVPYFVRILKSFMASVSFNQRQLTRMRPSRRSGFLRMGSKYALLPRILIAVDVSGSIQDEHLQTFFGAISQIFKSEIKGVDVIQFDAEVEGKAEQFRKIPQRITRLATGGTNFQCVIDYAAAHNFYDGLVIFTDGGAAEPRIPEKLHATVLWMTFAHAQKKDWMEKSGKVTWIFEDKEVIWVPAEAE